MQSIYLIDRNRMKDLSSVAWISEELANTDDAITASSCVKLLKEIVQPTESTENTNVIVSNTVQQQLILSDALHGLCDLDKLAQKSLVQNAIRKLYLMRFLIFNWKNQNSVLKHSIALKKQREVINLAYRFFSLTERVKQMSTCAISSGVVQLRLDLLKYAIPKRPCDCHIKTIQNCLKSWICRHRMRQHKKHVRNYPVKQLRYLTPTAGTGFIWVNPNFKKRWGGLMMDDYELPRTYPNYHPRNVPPDSNDWVYNYLSGNYILSEKSAKYTENTLRYHQRIASDYVYYRDRHDWVNMNRIGWKFEFETYSTSDFIHDYKMSFMLDSTSGKPLCNATRSARLAARAYQQQYLHTIGKYVRMVRKPQYQTRRRRGI